MWTRLFKRRKERSKLSTESNKKRMGRVSVLGKKINLSFDNREQTKHRSLFTRTRLSVLGLGIKDAGIMKSDEFQAFLSHLTIREQLELKRNNHWVIPMNSKIKKSFDLFIDVLIIYSALTSVFYLAFQKYGLGDEITDTLIWICFIIDFFLNFITETVNKKKQHIKNIKIISRKYLKRWFVIDLLGILPLRWAGHRNTEFFFRSLRVFKCSRLYDRIKIEKVANYISEKIFSEKNKMRKKFKVFILETWFLVKNVLALILGTYTLACLWFFYVNLVYTKNHEQDYYVKHFEMNEKSRVSQFLTSWYFIFSTFATVGFGDFFPTNNYEMIFGIILVLTAPSWFAFIMGNVIGVIKKLEDLWGTPDQMGRLNIWVSWIEQSHGFMPAKLKKKINNHYLHYFKNDRLDKMAYFQTDDITPLIEPQCEMYLALPESLKHQILEYIFDDIFYRFRYFFRHFSQDKYEMAKFLQPRIYKAYSIIIEIDEEVNEILFSNSGKFQIGMKIGDEYKELVTIAQNFIIGDYFVINDVKPNIQFIAVTNVHGYSLPSFVLKNLIQSNPLGMKNYTSLMMRCYKLIDQKVSEVQINQETSAMENSLKAFSEGFDDIIPAKYVLTDSIVESEYSILTDFEKIEQGVDNMKISRKNLLSRLKNKLKDHLGKAIGLKKQCQFYENFI